MTTVRNITATLEGGNRAVHLLLRAGGARVLGEGHEKAMMEIEVRASTIGRVLEDILHEPHGPSVKLDK